MLEAHTADSSQHWDMRAGSSVSAEAAGNGTETHAAARLGQSCFQLCTLQEAGGIKAQCWIAGAHQSVSLLSCVVSVLHPGALYTCPWALCCGGVWSTCAHAAGTCGASATSPAHKPF